MKTDNTELVSRIIEIVKRRNLVGLYIDPEDIDNEIYFDPKYADYKTFGLTMFYVKDDVMMCNYTIYGSYDTYDESCTLDNFVKYELEQIEELISEDGELSDSYITEAKKYQEENPEYWKNREF